MTNPPPVEVWRPSELVGLNVRKWRERRGWSQQKLVDRLNELLTDTPQWAVDLYEARQKDPSRPVDSRERRPRAKGESSSWNQPKIARLEGGKLQKVGIEEVFELALALDVAPIHLMAYGQGEGGEPLRIRLSPTLARLPHEVRQWIRGAKPLLGALDYRKNDDATTGWRFYLVESQPPSEWQLIKDAAQYADRVRQSLELLAPTSEEHVE